MSTANVFGKSIEPKLTFMIVNISPVVPVDKLEDTIDLLAPLGFKVSWIHTPGAEPLRYASVVDETGDHEIHLSESRGDGAGPLVVYFWVRDIDALAARAGTTAEDQSWGTREFWIRDKFGNTFRFGELRGQ